MERESVNMGPWGGLPASTATTATIRPDAVLEPPSPEDGTDLKRPFQIDMKEIMGNAVGNMSISPDNRDLVLASRKGLFIIDLEDPLRVPRFLPQGGTWDVADVQWNPHHSHSEYIVSTSSEKLLIWNLLLGGHGRTSTAIEHVLRSHYRAITDINWHTIEPDVVVSTGIDSWQWAWDLRTAQKPIMGLCAFGPPGTQVKWNRVDGNILASSHSNEVLIWDRRKGSLPIKRIRAHNAKIYGIDWAHGRRSELVTCSLDKTIKIWDTQSAQPNVVINTSYPVWRARDLPFGQGVLSLPQRGETALEMYAHEDSTMPIDRFEGHTDIVKEFVWRRGGNDNSEFQLITWSKDKCLWFWPVDPDVVQKAGMTPTRTTTMAPRRDSKISFSNPPIGSDVPPTLSAPIGFRGILAEVRAPPLHQPVRLLPHETTGTRKAAGPREDRPNSHRSRPVSIPAMAISVKDSGNVGTMSRGPFAGARSKEISTFDWLQNVKMLAGTRDGSPVADGGGSGSTSRMGSKSRPPSAIGPALSSTRGRSNSVDRASEYADPILTLQEEITFVVKQLNNATLKLEKAEFSNKKRTCTFGLQGPWGELTSVFLRTTFTFPRDYPQAKPPEGTPSVEVERSPLILNKQRAFILRRLRDLLQRERPCLEKCLRFLLFGDQQNSGHHAAIDSDSDSEDETRAGRRTDHGSSILRTDKNKNLAEPRTSQGVFGVNGQLVCFSRAPPRIVRNPLREISVSPSLNSRPPDTGPGLFQSPALLSDAVKRLSSVAQDREVQPAQSKRGDDANDGSVLRIMDNLFTFPHNTPRHPPASQKSRRVSDNSRQVDDDYALVSTRRSSVFIKSVEGVLGIPDSEAAGRYVLNGRDFADICKTNASVARLLGRSDHERVFRTLHVLASRRSNPEDHLAHGGIDPLLFGVVTRLYEEVMKEKDIQMLVYVSIMLLTAFPQENRRPKTTKEMSSTATSPGLVFPSRKISLEYFDPRRPRTRQGSPFSPPISNPPTPTHTPGGHIASLSSPSSKGSWSSVFTASSMRQLVSGVRTNTMATAPESVKQSSSLGNRRAAIKRDSARQSSSNSPVAKSSWEATEVLNGSVLPVRRRPTFSQVAARPISEKKHIAFYPSYERRIAPQVLSAQMRAQLMCHILSYAEMLLAWQLPEKRSELLKLVEDDVHDLVTDADAVVTDETLYPAPIGYSRSCGRCGNTEDPDKWTCSECHSRLPPRCSICRLSIKGLYHICSKCLHVSHMKCWRARDDAACATGCGCFCALPIYEPLSNGIVLISPIMPISAE